jgi:hypothetical protein
MRNANQTRRATARDLLLHLWRVEEQGVKNFHTERTHPQTALHPSYTVHERPPELMHKQSNTNRGTCRHARWLKLDLEDCDPEDRAVILRRTRIIRNQIIASRKHLRAQL